MYKQLALTLACLAGTAAAARAQATADAPVTVAVQANLGLTETGTTDFGTLNNNAGSGTVDPIAPAAGTTTAMFTASGTPNANIRATWTSVSLRLSDNSASVSFTPKLSSSAANTQSGSTVTTSGSTVALNATGNAYFWLGGDVTLAANQKPGTYSGTFTLTVVYN